MSSPFIPKRIVVTAYPKMPEAFTEAEAMSIFLKEKGIDAPVGSLYDEQLRKRVKQGDFDMLIAVGGDGSVLRAGHLCAPSGVPILGVNLGRLGFLIQIDRKEWRDYFMRLLSGEAWIENRMMLRAEHIRAGEKLNSSLALNEVSTTCWSVIELYAVLRAAWQLPNWSVSSFTNMAFRTSILCCCQTVSIRIRISFRLRRRSGLSMACSRSKFCSFLVVLA